MQRLLSSKVGRTGLVQTQLHTDNDHSDPDCPGGAVAAAGPRGGQIHVERYRVGCGIDMHESLQCVLGGNHTGGYEL